MLSISKFRLDDNHREILDTDSNPFPYICNYAESNPCLDQCFSWHWHPAFEIDYVEEGEFEFKTTEQTITLKKGEAVFINSNVMHDIRPTGKAKDCKLYAHIFDMHFLSGMYNSIFEQTYIVPILKNKQLQAFSICPDHYTAIKMMGNILRMIELAVSEPFGYEFEIRTELGRFWCLLLEDTKPLRSQTSESNQTDIERVKQMMEYIHQHYNKKISLDDISSAASISGRECARCFQRCIHVSPVNYLNEYRIRMAAQMLLQTQDSIITISENCGFSSSSYFGKVFHETMNCTPKEYRQKKSE